MAGVISPSLTFFSNGFLNNVPLAFSLYFHNQEKGLFWDFHELSIHQQNEWKRLDHLELVAKILFCQMVLIPLHLSILLLVAYIEWGQEKYVNETVVYIQGSPNSSCSYLQLQGCALFTFLFSIYEFYNYYLNSQ